MTPDERLTILDMPTDLLKYATPEELSMYEQALEIEGKLFGLVDYMQAVNPLVKAYKHLLVLGEYIDALLDGRLYADGPGPAPVLGLDPDGSGAAWVHPARGDIVVYNLAIHEPPRHGKSFAVSHHLPAYFLTKFPEYSVILASYEEEFAKSWGAKVRDLLVETENTFGVTVDGGKGAAKGFFTLKGHRGEFKAAGAGASITGRGGKLLIVDDPIKNSEDAQSEKLRNGQEDWWWSTFFNRRETWVDHNETPARVILMNTRWHEDDLRGRVVDRDREHWCVLNIPAIWEPSDEETEDPIGREVGEPIEEGIISLRDLNHLRKQSPLWFESMYQGRPFIAEGNQIKKPFQVYDLEDGYYTLYFADGHRLRIEEADCMRFATMDLAASTKTTADYTVITTFDLSKTVPRYLMVRNVERSRIETEGHRTLLERQHSLFRFSYVLVEAQTYGTNLINLMQRGQGAIQVRPVQSDKDKVTRAQGTIVPMIQAQRLFFPKPEAAAWYIPFEKELLKFPNATHDDMVDTLSYGCQEALNLPDYIRRKEYSHGSKGRLERLEDRMRQRRSPDSHPDLGRGY